MLIEFSVENFKSFRDKATLSMVAAKAEKKLPENVITNENTSGLSLLKSAAIYGENASGKSNFYQALFSMAAVVVTSMGSGIANLKPFKNEAVCEDKPSFFETILLIDGVRYSYGFTANKNGIYEEWLYSYPKRQPRLLFERYQTGNGQVFKLGNHWDGPKKTIKDIKIPDILFISLASKLGSPISEKIVHFFSSLRFISRAYGDTVVYDLIRSGIFKEEDVKNNLLKQMITLLQMADTGITDFNIEEGKTLFDKIINLNKNVSFTEDTLDRIKDSISDHESIKSYEVKTYHKGIDKSGSEIDIPFQFDEESLGTQHFFHVALISLYSLYKGALMIADEFNSGLHPLLARKLIKLFHDEKTNPNGAQLILTTHDAGLLEGDIFRRDQVWFTERGQDGASVLFPLWDFKKTPRKKENLMRGYLAGRYGGIPILEDFEGLNLGKSEQ